MRMIKQVYGRKTLSFGETELVASEGEDIDRRFRYAIQNVIDEELIKFGYDWTWIELYCEGAIKNVQFGNPKSFLDYLSVMGLESLPNRSTLSRKADVVKGEYPNWTFLDTNNSAEINRRKRVVGRFIFYYNKFSRV